MNFEDTSSFQCKWWSWHCNTLNNRALEIGLRAAVFVPAALLSGFLYLQVIQQLKAGPQNDRKAVLSRAFIFLCISWVVCVAPYQALEVYYLDFRTNYFDPLNHHQLLDKSPMDFKQLSQRDNFYYNAKQKTFILVEGFLAVLLFSYGFLNSLLLLILLKPFREPIKKLVDFLHCH